MKEIRVGIIGGGMISHRHMVVYSNIQRYAEQLGFTAKVVACAEIDKIYVHTTMSSLVIIMLPPP